MIDFEETDVHLKIAQNPSSPINVQMRGVVQMLQCALAPAVHAQHGQAAIGHLGPENTIKKAETDKTVRIFGE